MSSMRSNRVLLSDKHYHQMNLSEQYIGIIAHALDILEIAFSAEPDYVRLIRKVEDEFQEQLLREPTILANHQQ